MTAPRRAGGAPCRGCRERRIARRDLLIATGSAGLLAALGGCTPAPSKPDTRPVAMVYRGRASCSGCSEAVAGLLENNPTSFRTIFVGPGENVPLTADSLATATIYAQPGGGTVGSAWRRMHGYSDIIRNWVHGGGHYLGFCLGAYLAGATPGFGLLPGDTAEYVGSPGATITDTDDTVIALRWGATERHMYFQDGPYFTLNPGAPATVLATYNTGTPAAVVTPYGAGRVGVVGPHPEATQSWYTGAGLTNPDGIRLDLGHDLIAHTIHGPPGTG